MDQNILDLITVWAPIVLVLLSIVNSVTKHYTKFNGWIRIVMLIVERASFLASKNAPKRIKAPGTSLPPDQTMEHMREFQDRLRSFYAQKNNRISGKKAHSARRQGNI